MPSTNKEEPKKETNEEEDAIIKTDGKINAIQEENKIETEKKDDAIKEAIVDAKEVYIGNVNYIYSPVEPCLRFDQNNALMSDYMMN